MCRNIALSERSAYAHLQVYLRELQEEAGLTDPALQHIARVCGQRCGHK